MGQKINPNILRLGVTKSWKTEFFEKKNQDLPKYTFKDLEIKNYLERFLETHGILLHDYRQNFSNSTINCYLSYFLTPQFLLKTDKTNEKLKKLVLLNSKGEKKLFIKKDSTKNFNKINFYEIGSKSLILTDSVEENRKVVSKRLFNNKIYANKINKYLLINNYKHKLVIRNDIIFEKKIMKNALKKVFKVLNLFTENKHDIILNFSCLNKKLNFSQETNDKIILLKKFKNTAFFKEGIELLFHTVNNKNSSNLLARFIAFQIKKVKRQKFFLTFLKKTLSFLINSNVSKIKGIKIMIKGRLNGVPKAKHKTISIGNLPIQTISNYVDYTQTATHNNNGSYGIKVWLIKK